MADDLQAYLANEREENEPKLRKIARWLRKNTTFKNFIRVLVAGGCLAIFAWEIRNSSLGYQQAFNPGMFLAVVLAIGLTALLVALSDYAYEQFSKKNIASGIGVTIIALFCAVLVMFGVWSNMAGDSYNSGQRGEDNRVQKELLLSELSTLRLRISSYREPIDYASAKEALRYLEEDIGPNMRLGDMKEECANDLSTAQRTFCNEAQELRRKILDLEAIVKNHESDKQQLALKTKELEEFEDVTGAEHFKAMADMAGPTATGAAMDWKMFSNYGTLILSTLFLIVGVFGALVIKRI